MEMPVGGRSVIKLKQMSDYIFLYTCICTYMYMYIHALKFKQSTILNVSSSGTTTIEQAIRDSTDLGVKVILNP